jgi:CRISPR-associated protein Cas1
MKSAYAALSRLEENSPESISELRTLEANCAAAYFPIKWRGNSRRPIVENWYSIGARSSPYHLSGNRTAAHPVNAMLNYAYAALESEIRIKDPPIFRSCGLGTGTGSNTRLTSG